MRDYPPPSVPPFTGNAWEHFVIPDGAALPPDCVDCGPTAGGTLVKRCWGAEVPYTATRPAWRYEVRMIDGRVERTLTLQEP
jgi:hypothetical protein